MNELAVCKARALRQLREIFVNNPRTDRVCTAIDDLIARKQVGVPGDHGSVLIVGPSHSGKSRSISYAIRRYSSEGAEHPPILHVTLPEDVNRKSLILAMFDAAEDRGYFRGDRLSGTHHDLQTRILRLLKHAGILAVVLDECHHIRYEKKNDAGHTVGEMIKRFLIEGPCPIILAGVGNDAKKPYTENQQLMNRSLPFVELDPLDWEVSADRDFYQDFFVSYLKQVHALNFTGNLALLQSEEFAEALFSACGGIIGVAIILFQYAVMRMIEDGRRDLSLLDFSRAHSALAVTDDLDTENKFRELVDGGLEFA